MTIEILFLEYFILFFPFYSVNFHTVFPCIGGEKIASLSLSHDRLVGPQLF